MFVCSKLFSEFVSAEGRTKLICRVVASSSLPFRQLSCNLFVVRGVMHRKMLARNKLRANGFSETTETLICECDCEVNIEDTAIVSNGVFNDQLQNRVYLFVYMLFATYTFIK